MRSRNMVGNALALTAEAVPIRRSRPASA